MNNLSLQIKVVPMRIPVISSSGEVKRVSLNDDRTLGAFIEYENFLRKSAYKNTSINTNDAFFDDTDMVSGYYLLVVYEGFTRTPLLSCRYYCDKEVIKKYLGGDNDSNAELIYLDNKFDINNYDKGKLFLADRLSGNVNNQRYRQNRPIIFSLFYSEISRRMKSNVLLLMIRKEKYDKQLSKYLRMGFVLLGSTLHKGKEHDIVLIDWKDEK